jgi:spermidine synthase
MQAPMRVPVQYKVAALLSGSGACALVYQTVWEREFRLFFGVSTAAAAAVVAIFIGGLGIGGLAFGRHVDRHPNPLMLYARLEATVAVSTGATPWLIAAARRIYVGLGGSVALTPAGATCIRLALATLVLGLPTVAMGGTLPAAARAVQGRDRDAPVRVGLLYGANTLGAVVGAVTSTFLMIEVFGNRLTLWLACLVNLLVAVVAHALARSANASPEGAVTLDTSQPSAPASPLPPRAFVLVAASVVGFAFFLMELVDYRMLGPLVGGTIFTFSLVLALALAGIGWGGLLHGHHHARHKATLSAFGLSCALEALGIALPFALGDEIALLALRLRPLADFGLPGYAVSAGLVTAIVVVPGAVVAGYQFPLLIGLAGDVGLGRSVGEVYAANTLGAIAGAIAGGFGLLAVLSAPGCWRLAAALLAALAVVTVAICAARESRSWRLVSPALVAAVACLCLCATGPTALWRHRAIGAGRTSLEAYSDPNRAHAERNAARRSVLWEADGREASVAILADDDLSLVVGGKTDGTARADAATQVGSALLPAFLHPSPRRAFVVGMATGCTAGWLAAVPSIERVDVAELEPATLEMARRSAAVNHSALENPKVHMVVADGREVLLTSREPYDLVVSEPSNPYRAGVATLYTQEYYRAIRARLGGDGLFAQWVQGYEVDAASVRLVIATIASVFPYAELWELMPNDLFVVAGDHPPDWDPPALRRKLEKPPFREGFRGAWGAGDLEGVVAHFRASDALVRKVAATAGDAVNTDDANTLEFSFARTLGKRGLFDVADVVAFARQMHADHPPVSTGAIDFGRVAEETASSRVADEVPPAMVMDVPPEVLTRTRAKLAYVAGELGTAARTWRSQPIGPRSPIELLLVAESFTQIGESTASGYVDALAEIAPTNAACVRARGSCLVHGASCANDLGDALARLQTDPWVFEPLARRTLAAASDFAVGHPDQAAALLGRLEQPFAALILDGTRTATLVRTSAATGDFPRCAAAYQRTEQYPMWDLTNLQRRALCYEKVGSPLASRALRDIAEFLSQAPSSFAAGL